MSLWENRTAIWCTCGTCALSVDMEDVGSEGSVPGRRMVFVDFWESGHRPLFFTRVRLAWNLLVHGAPPNGVVLDEGETLRLLEALTQVSGKKEAAA